ncbi:hypothetical protein B6U66_02045 [Candidatus Bathyarchaeota archaeon ex4484_135]|nr:MAG: hypothetical protein B6U66_02045 [Candidatus Bathyarchaeota archaeon ex4484_135]
MEGMKEKGLIALVLAIAHLSLLLAILLHAGAALAEGREVVVVELRMDINAGAEELVRRAFSYASSRQASVEALVLEIDTDGGWIYAMDRIIGLLAKCPCSTVAFVPRDGRCFSAGAYIFMACEKTAMAPGSAIGSCMPMDAMGNPADEKVVNAMAARMRALASSHGRNATAAEEMVLKNADYTAEEALRLGLCDLMASSLDGLLSKLGFANASLTYFGPDWHVQFLSTISNPLVQGLLMWVAMWLILIDIFHPTFVLSVIAVALLALALWGAGVIHTHPLALILVALGSALTLVELKKPGVGLEIVGILLIAAGIVFAYQLEPFMVIQGPEIAVLIVALAGGGLLGYYLYAMRAALKKRPKLHEPERLVGLSGVAKTDIMPDKPGVVLAESEEWTATSDEFIPAGSKVRIISVEGLMLKVRREEKP